MRICPSQWWIWFLKRLHLLVNYHRAATLGHLARELRTAVFLSKVRLLFHFMIVERALITGERGVSVICKVLIDCVLIRILIVVFVGNCGGIWLLFQKSWNGHSLFRLQFYGGLSIKLLVGRRHAIILNCGGGRSWNLLLLITCESSGYFAEGCGRVQAWQLWGVQFIFSSTFF